MYSMRSAQQPSPCTRLEKGERSEPRKIHGMCGVTLLVSRVYACTKNHEVLGYHPGILSEIPICFVPFRLWHITGFTLEYIQFIASLISYGMSIHKVREIMYEKIERWYHHQKLKFKVLNRTASFPAHEAWLHWFSPILPSHHSISSCFLTDFWDKETVYVKCMQNTSVDELHSWLSCDHTFASASKWGH